MCPGKLQCHVEGQGDCVGVPTCPHKDENGKLPDECPAAVPDPPP